MIRQHRNDTGLGRCPSGHAMRDAPFRTGAKREQAWQLVDAVALPDGVVSPSAMMAIDDPLYGRASIPDD
jgi:hypothetical protein